MRVSSESYAFNSIITPARNRLRRVMPRVAAAAVVLLIMWLLIRNSRTYQTSSVSWLLGFLTFLFIALPATYFGLVAMRWLKRRVLWRVRRRLVITYLLIGLTPIFLLTLLGLALTIGSSNRALMRVVTTEIGATETETLSNVRQMVVALGQQSPGINDQTLLDAHAASFQPSLPGASIAMWRGRRGGDTAALGCGESAQFVSATQGEETRGVGTNATSLGAPLPEWLCGRDEWSGLVYIPASASSEVAFDTPSIRAVVRGSAGGQPVVLLLEVPVSRAFVRHVYDHTGVKLYPYFVNWGSLNARRRAHTEEGGQTGDGADQREAERLFNEDQFGDPIPWKRFPVRLPATDWTSGVKRPNHLAFWLGWGWDQLLGGGLLTEEGETWRRILLIVSVILLGIELLALASAAWMTRAVTGTVHRLYRATEHIKRGDFSHRVEVRSHDQLGELAEAFNEMATNVEGLLEERVEHERLEREVEIAAEVQALLFPREVPHLETAGIAGECRAARGVAGDYYDYVEVVPGLVALVLGDVSGKGISASLVMSNLQAALRAQVTIISERLRFLGRDDAAAGAAETGGDPSREPTGELTRRGANNTVAEVVGSINSQLCRSTDANRFATLFLALYDDRTRLLRYTNAGHNAAILVRADGTTERLSAGGMLAGAFDWARYEEARTRLEAGDLLLVFSDGISEAQNSVGEEYGEERLVQFAREHRGISAEEMRKAIFAEMDSWTSSEERDDDQTLVILKMVEP